jgi:vacuolar-type H+-ATPase subunit I/STV1
MNQEHGQGQKSEAVGVRGSQGHESIRPYTHGSEALSGVSRGLGGQSVTINREDSKEGARDFDPFGGVIDQLIDDARKQLVKSQECIVWYREEAKEYQEKLNNLIKLKELQQQQQQQMRELQAKSSSNHSEESLAE